MTAIGHLARHVEENRIMFGTTAIHNLGDISRPTGDFFYVDNEDETHFIGAWLTGIGYFNVRFPKEDCRKLTSDEREMLANQQVVIR